MIQIIDFKAFDKPVFKAQVSVRMPKWGGFIIKRIKVFEKENKRWITFPSEEFEKDGKKCYFQFNAFDTPEMESLFRDQFFKAYDEYKRNNVFKEVA